MIVYRICKARYAKDLSGTGAERFGGRWNSKGTPLLYTSSSRALCLLELAVHLPLTNIPDNYQMVSIELPDDKMSTLAKKKWPSDWNSIPHENASQLLGDAFVQNQKHLALKVPSAVVEGDFNCIINPRHLAMNTVSVQDVSPCSFDDRLFR